MESELNKPEPHSEGRLRRQYAFGDFTLDLEHRVLRRGGQEVTLRPKSFEVLACLVEHHGQLVTRTYLMDAVWPDTAVIDNSLTQCMVEVRRALEDEPQQWIRTVTRRGYLFAGPVTTPVLEFPVPPVPHDSRDPSPVSVVGQPGLSPASRPSQRTRNRAAALLALAAGSVLVGSFVWRLWRGPENTEPFRAVPLNSLPGVQHYPSFAPDGNYVAFTWTGPNQDNQDVYVQQIGSGSPLRRTTDPAIDYNPVWSPDGQWIAFLRRRWQTGTSELRLIPPLGGSERRLTEVRIRDSYYLLPPYQTWCPDSKCLIVTDSQGEGRPAALFIVSLDTGTKAPLTRPEFPVLGDTNPAVSADGTWLVFRRQNTLHNSELYRVALSRRPAEAEHDHLAGLTSVGEPHQVATGTVDAAYPTWVPGNREIVFSDKRSLWRLVVPGKNTPARLPFAGEAGMMPAVGRFGQMLRLVYVRNSLDTDIWRVGLRTAGAPAFAPPVVAISSTRKDTTPQLSPDGRRVAFVSERLGTSEIWVSDPDGSNAAQLTSMAAVSGAPCWSPDGERIVFQSNPEGQFEVYLIPAAGGKPRNLTSHRAGDFRPSFSRDGRWIYFTSNRTGERRIWKLPVSGGDALQVTSNVAFAAFESPDGAYIYYNQTMETPSPLWRQSVSGGAPVKVLEGVVRAAFTVLERGIYYIDRPSGAGGLLYTDQPSGETRLQYFDFDTGKTTTVARDLGNVYLGLTASKDGRTVLYSRVDSSVDDLMVVDNFR